MDRLVGRLLSSRVGDPVEDVRALLQRLGPKRKAKVGVNQVRPHHGLENPDGAFS